MADLIDENRIWKEQLIGEYFVEEDVTYILKIYLPQILAVDRSTHVEL